jgi:Family of unknown function (DUF6159)
MFDSFDRSWDLFKESLSVLTRDKRLIWFPVLSAITTIVVSVSVLAPLYAAGVLGHFSAREFLRHNRSEAYVILFLVSYAHYFITIFFNSALVAAAGLSLEGVPPLVNDGLRAAGRRLGRIAYWALIATTIGLALRAIRRQAGRGGRYAAGFLGVTWSLIVYFMIPVIVFEDHPVWQSMDRSMALCRETWGEEATTGVGFGLISLLASLPALVVIYAGFQSRSVVGVAGGVLYFLAITSVISAAGGVFRAAMYRYATHQHAPHWFSADALQGVFTAGSDRMFRPSSDGVKPALPATLLSVNVIPSATGALYVMRVRVADAEYHASYSLEALDPGFRADSWEPGTKLELRIEGHSLLISGSGCPGIWCHFTKAAASHSS